MTTPKTQERKDIVNSRWQMRQIWDAAVRSMPDSYTVYNDSYGDRLEEPREVCMIKASKTY